MKKLKYYTVIGIFFVLIVGSLAHFFYVWSGNNYIVGLFTPVNESIWEHMKLLFFPMLIYSLFMIYKTKADFPCIVPALLSGILAGTILIPILFYAYTAIIGKDIFLLDIATFILSIIIAFWISFKSALSCRFSRYTPALCGTVCVFLFCFLVFTYHPPDFEIFKYPDVS